MTSVGVLVCGALAALVASSADTIPRPHVLKAYEIVPPSADDMELVYPEKAARLEVAGRVVLDCIIRSDNGLICQVGSENPPDQGFGAAAVELANKIHIRPLVSWSLAGLHITVPIRFEPPPSD